MRKFGVLLAVGLLTACGTKGPLVLEPEKLPPVKFATIRCVSPVLTLTQQASAPPDIRRLRKVSSPLSGWIA